MKKPIATIKAPGAVGPYVQAVDTGAAVYTSGQLGIDPKTGKLEEGIEAQTHRSLTNLKHILEEAGLSLKDVVKVTVFVQDLKDFAAVNAIYGTYFEGAYPARSCVQVAALPMGGLVEMECIAVRG